MLAGIAKWIKRLLIFCWLLFICILGAWLATQNEQPLSISLFIVQLPELTAGLYMCFIFTAGVLLGFLTSYISTQGRLLARNRALKKAKKEVSSLKQVAVKE